MESLTAYIKDSYNELINKVEWPDRANLLNSTVAVIVTLAILTLIIVLMDAAANGLMNLIYQI